MTVAINVWSSGECPGTFGLCQVSHKTKYPITLFSYFGPQNLDLKLQHILDQEIDMCTSEMGKQFLARLYTFFPKAHSTQTFSSCPTVVAFWSSVSLLHLAYSANHLSKAPSPFP